MPVSLHPTPKPSLPLALVGATIAAAFDHRWLTRPIVELARAHDLAAARVSRWRTRLQPAFEAALAGATRRGRPPVVAPSPAPDVVTADLLAIAAAVIAQTRIPRRVADRLVAGAQRLHDHHHLTQRDFCARLGIPARTFRYWKRRPPARPTLAPPRPPPPHLTPDRHEGRFDLRVTLPGLQTMSDTTDWQLFGVDLKVTATMDPGDRQHQPWQTFAVEAAETAQVVSDTIARAVADRPGMQVITDQGTPFLAELSRAAYEALHADHAPCVEGAPTDKAPLERSFLDIKRLLDPIAQLTSKLAAIIPALCREDLARPVAALLLATYLRVFHLGHRDRPHPLAATDPQLLHHIADEQRDKAHRELASKKMLLAELFQGLGCTGSREVFIRTFRHHHLADLQAAQRALAQHWWCCCRVHSPNRYFAKILWNAALEGRERRERERRQRAADTARQQGHRTDQATEAFLTAHPEELLRQGLDLVVGLGETDFGRQLLRTLGGPAPILIARAVELIRAAAPAVFLDPIEATWRAWAATADPVHAPLLPVARQVLDACLNPALATTPLTVPEPSEILSLRAVNNHARPPPVLRNYPAGTGGS